MRSRSTAVMAKRLRVEWASGVPSSFHPAGRGLVRMGGGKRKSDRQWERFSRARVSKRIQLAPFGAFGPAGDAARDFGGPVALSRGTRRVFKRPPGAVDDVELSVGGSTRAHRQVSPGRLRRRLNRAALESRRSACAYKRAVDSGTPLQPVHLRPPGLHAES